MELLAQTDVRSLLQFLQKIYAIHALDAFPALAISALEWLLPSDYYAYSEVPLCGGEAAVAITQPSIEAILHNHWEILEQHRHEHPLLAAHQNYPGAVKISDFLSQRQFRRLALYNEFFKAASIRYQMSVTIPGKPGFLTGMVVNRKGLDFSEKERQLLNVIRPHLAQAYQNAEAFTLMGRALGAFGREVLYVDRDGRIRYASHDALRQVAKYFPEPAGQRLPGDLDRWVRKQQGRLRGETDDLPLTGPLVVDQGDKRIVVRFLPGEDGLGDMVLLEEQQIRISPASLRTLGLSAREAEVLAWATQGRTVAEISQILFVSASTVEKHMEHIYAKLGVHSRAEAMAQAYRAAKQWG